MILRFKLYTVAGATALLSAPGAGDAFAISSATSARRTRSATTATARLLLSLNPDWNNDDFLSSLGGGREALDAANDKYFEQAENRAAMDAWRAKQMQQQKQQQQQPPQQQMQQPPPSQLGMGQPPPQFAQQPPPLMSAPPPPPPQQPMHPPPQQFYDANGNPVTMPMVYDANGNLVPFQMPQMQQPQMQQPQMPPQINPGPSLEPNPLEPPLPPKTKGTDNPRPVGYNPDAYTISNTADVYFAQLKQDSKVRKMARLSGDTVRANQVFADSSVQQIRESWVDNPYTREKNLAEARAEIEGAVRIQTQGDGDAPVKSGISYKEKLQQMKAKRGGGGGGVAAALKGERSPVRAAAAPLKVEAPPAVEALPKAEQPKVGMTSPPKMDGPKVGFPAPTQVIPPPPLRIERPMPTNVAPPAVTTRTPMMGAVAAAAAAQSTSTDEDDVRKQVRTLQGLLLKHRGGPGFGAGRLKAPEATRLENTLEEVKGILRSEVGGVVAKVAPVTSSMAGSAMPQMAQQQSVGASSPPPPRSMPPTSASPAPAQAAAMVSSAMSSPPPDPLAGSVACVEAALKMYKDSSPADREAMMIPLREALMAAASASNRYIAESELNAHKVAMEAGPSVAFAAMGSTTQPEKPMMGFPTTYAVTKPDKDEQGSFAPAAERSMAENDRKLEEVYEALLKAGGKGGKLGLRNISGDEANALAEKLQTMRGVLLDELNS